MIGLGSASDHENVLAALAKSQAIIEFDLQGNILRANENFCKTLGYSEAEIVGKHHRIFCEKSLTDSHAYTDFWKRLSSGAFDSGAYKRIDKQGREIWIQASYNPVCRRGKPYKIVKFAADITAAKEKAVEDAGKLEAISRSQAIIEFRPTGEIITANANFCSAMGYALSEIVGKHHRIFCRPDYAATADYAAFWQRLAEGGFEANEFVRVAKNGREIWIQAAYNPILDASGRVTKVVKFATDVTERMTAINQVNKGLAALSDGDLTVVLDRPFVPSMEELRDNFNGSIAKLNATMRNFGELSVGIAEGSSEISGAADSFSRRTEQQAASLEQAAAALDQITMTVSDTSERARLAGALVSTTRDGAQASGEIMDKAVAAMGEIEQSSREISSILGVIDDIAFQTNLLALNAGVEAARAGEAGKGFAVVAQEVRELAQRAATAAKEIKTLISTSDKLVGRGVDLVGRTGLALKQIVDQVGDIDRNIMAIVDAAQEQSVALKEISSSVNAMDQATQQNAAMAEETTAASAAQATQAALLREQLTQFRCDSGRTTQPGHGRIGSYAA
jgi:methyl-accepting chemotaxis protein